jgi:hypothetical protein
VSANKKGTSTPTATTIARALTNQRTGRPAPTLKTALEQFKQQVAAKQVHAVHIKSRELRALKSCAERNTEAVEAPAWPALKHRAGKAVLLSRPTFI